VSSLLAIADRLSCELDVLRFRPPVAFVYNPLDYAREAYATYVARFGQGPKEALLVGMNPGPFGMAQTGVPFGEVSMARDWLGLEAPVGKPKKEHPKRPITGYACHRSEVSGARVWSFARDRFGTPERFFRRFLVLNYCPLVFMEESGRNLTPDKLPAKEKERLFRACDRALVEHVERLAPKYVIGIGAFAAERARAALADRPDLVTGCILHPSPANPKANGGWAEIVAEQLAALGIALPQSNGGAARQRA
jgi:single-strand selective monofunctional uracil DNA glycosylase